MKVRRTVRTVSLMSFFNQIQQIKPTIMPNKGPPKETLTKFESTPKADALSPLTKLMKSMKKTMAVPSFSKDSPSTNKLKCTLAPNYFSKATTATGSVADKTHPRVSASFQLRSSSPYPSISLKMKAIMIAPHKTPGPASKRILTNDFLKTCQSQLKAKDNDCFT